MAGENPEDSRTGAADEFLSKGKWQRFQVLVMGPIMNLVLAVIVMAVVLYQGALVPAFEQEPVVIGTFAEGSAAAKAGLKIGDRVVTVDGKPVGTWDQFAMAIVPKAKREVAIGFVRDGQPGQVTVVPDGQGKYELGDIGIQPADLSRDPRFQSRLSGRAKPVCSPATASWPPEARRRSRARASSR